MSKPMILFFKDGYSHKYFVPFQILQPFVMLLDSLVGIILLPTTVQSNIYGTYLKALVHKQMAKRIRNHAKAN